MPKTITSRLNPTHHDSNSLSTKTSFSAGRNSILNIIKIHRGQPSRRSRSGQDEVDSPEQTKRKRKREKRMACILDEDQVDADHRAGQGRPDSLHGTTGRHIAGIDCSACGDDDTASDFEGGQIEVFDVVSFFFTS